MTAVFHQGEYSILGEAPEGNLLNSEPVRKYITDKLAGNPSDFDAIYSSLKLFHTYETLFIDSLLKK
jgi:hypothetical protein